MLTNVFPARTPRRYAASIHRVRPWFKTTDGVRVNSRLIRAADGPALVEFYRRMSPESRRRRFHMYGDNFTDEVIRERAAFLAGVKNDRERGAVMATVEEEGIERVIGVARLARLSPESDIVEAAVVVRDDFQRRGVARELLRRLVLLAKHMEAKTILAIIQADNVAAIRAFRGLDLPTETDVRRGEMEMYISVPG